MLIVDASCLYEIVADATGAEQVRARLAGDDDQAAPHIIDVEVLGIIRRDRLLGRAWEPRGTVRSWDAM